MTSNDVTTLNGNFKEVYANNLSFLMPEGFKVQKMVSFVPKDKMPGNSYHQPVVLQHEHGFTYAAAGSDDFVLNDAVAGQTKDATIVGAQMLLTSRLGYEAAHRASSGGKRAFVQATQYLVENMWLSTKKRLEVELLHGQTELGIVSALNTATVVFTAASWAPGPFGGGEGAKVEIFSANLGTQRISAGAVSTFTITAVDIDNKSITVTPTPVGVIATDRVMFLGQYNFSTSTWASAKGLMSILKNTGSIFSIDAATYSLWKASTQSAAGAALSFDVLQQAEAKSVAKGNDQPVQVLVAPKVWAKLMTDQAALRRHGDPNKKNRYEVGAEELAFYGITGLIEIIPSIFVKEGEAPMICKKLFSRVGATDITFRLQDRGDEFFLHVPGRSSYELRNYSNQALFCEAIGKNVLINNIVV